MKGLNVKKLAAIGAGVALMGMALAPMAAALTKEEILKGDGTPFDVVVGENAARTDYLWGGNIAAKLAQLATEDTPVSCNVLGWAEGTAPEGGETSEACGGLTVDLTIGGTTTYDKESSKTYNSTNLNSLAGTAAEFDAELSNAQIESLYKDTVSWRLNNSNYTQTITEYIGFEADAKMDYTHPTVDDLVLELNAENDFNYRVNYSKGLPVDQSATTITDFQEGAGDNVTAVFFGTEYKLYDVDTTRSGGAVTSVDQIKLVEATGEKTYDIGEEITGLIGAGDYDGQEMTVRVDNVWSASKAQFTLVDAEGNDVDEYSATAEGVYLETGFEDSSSDYALDTSLFLKTINFNAATGEGNVVIAKGTDLLTIRNNEQYPYSSTDTDTTDDYWVASFTKSTCTSPDVNVITDIIIKNSVKVWKYGSGSDLVYAASPYGLTGNENTEIAFLEGEPEDTPGYGYAKIEFPGWKGSEERTEIKIADGKYVEYTDASGTDHKIPFYHELSNNSTQGTFVIDNQTFYYKTNTADINFLIDATTDVINGTTPMNIDGNLRTDQGLWNPITTKNTRVVDLNGITVTCTSYGLATGHLDFNCLADGNFRVSTEQLSGLATTDTSWIGYNANDTVNSTTWYYDANNTATATGRATIPLTGNNTNDQIYNYAFNDNETYDSFWLLLDTATDFGVYYDKDIQIYGTDTGEDGVVDVTYYLPDKLDLGGDPADTAAIYVATFGVMDNTATDLWDSRIYVTTSDDKLWVKNDNLSWYGNDVNYNDTAENWVLRQDLPNSYTTTAYTDFGSKLDVSDGYFFADIPQNQEKLYMVVTGSSTTTSVEGGTTFCGGEDCDYPSLVLDEEQLVSTTSYNVTGIECETCECSGVAGDIANVEVEPSVSAVKKLNKIGSQIVYTDNMAPNTGIVAVGGQFVNKKSNGAVFDGDLTLADLLTTASDTVVDKTVDGDWVVAGFTAADTATAAQEFIEMLDAVFE